MPIHDWTRVDAGIFHDFHGAWITEMRTAFNKGLLPPGYYALGEQVMGSAGPDVLTLQRPRHGSPPPEPTGGVALAVSPPKVDLRARMVRKPSRRKAKRIVIRHVSDHRLIAVIEIVSPGNKNNRRGMADLLRKVRGLLEVGIHLLLIDLFPPSSRDPHGLPDLICKQVGNEPLPLPADRPLSVAAYTAGLAPEAFVQPLAVGELLPDMPLFLTPDVYVPVPLEATYEEAWDGVPDYWRDVISGRPPA
ncbi:MAG: DUF4058 family protein [Gemmataceae bacterium]